MAKSPGRRKDGRGGRGATASAARKAGEDRTGRTGRAPERGRREHEPKGRTSGRPKDAPDARRDAPEPKDRAAATAAGAAARKARPPAARTEQRRQPAPRPASPGVVTRSGTVALVGRSNVGKSTLLNAALELPLAIVSPTPQTTRDSLLGIVRHAGAEIGLCDTPGLHRAKSALGRSMNRSARDAIHAADVVVLVTSVGPLTAKSPTPLEGDLRILADVPAGKPVVLVLNKVDRLRSKVALLPLLEAWSRVRPLAAVVPISALRADGVTRVLDEVARILPEGPRRFDADELTDRPLRYFAAEYVREPILTATREEVPHAVAVAIDRFDEPIDPAEPLRILATIHVERDGQKRILVGSGGEMLKRIGTAARLRLEALCGRHVYLELWVHVTPSWRERPAELAALGYETGRSMSPRAHVAPTTGRVVGTELEEDAEPAEDVVADEGEVPEPPEDASLVDDVDDAGEDS